MHIEKGFERPLQPVQAILAVLYLIFLAVMVTRTRIWLAIWVSFCHGPCVMRCTGRVWRLLAPCVINPMHIEKGFERPLQPVQAILAVLYLIFCAKMVTKITIWAANWVSFWYDLCVI